MLERWTGEPERNVYVRLCTLKDGVKDANRVVEGQVDQALCLVLDFDAKDGHRLNVDALPIPPTEVVVTSRLPEPSYQVRYWYATPVAPARHKEIAEWFKNRLGLSDKAFDDSGTGTTGHLWRVLGSLNWPNRGKIDAGRPRDGQEVRCLEGWTYSDERRLDPSKITAAAAAVSAPSASTIIKHPWLNGGEIEVRGEREAQLIREALTLKNTDVRLLDVDDVPALSELAKVQILYCVKSIDDLVQGDDGAFVRKPKPELGYTDSDVLVAFAGEAIRCGISPVDIFSLMVNPRHAISAHPLKDKKQPLLRVCTRAFVKAVVTGDDLGKTVVGGINHDSIALAFAKHYANELRYCAKFGAWYRWNGSLWAEDQSEEVIEMARPFCREAANFAAFDAFKILSRSGVASVPALARVDRRLATVPGDWDRNLDIINTPEGIVYLEEGGRLGPPDMDELCTRITAVSPATGEPALWMKTLREVTSTEDDVEHEDVVGFLQRLFGLALSGRVTEHVLPFFWGPGGNGKSLVMRVVEHIMGSYVKQIPASSLMSSGLEQHPTDLAGLRGARLVLANETEVGKSWAEARIKMMTGADTITARFMRQDFFEYTPQFLLIAVGNHKPAFRNVDAALARRIILIPFSRVIPPERQDKYRYDKLLKEAPQILNWMIQGYVTWRKERLRVPESIKEATMAYLESEDRFGTWMRECLLTEKGAHCAIGDLHACYELWARKHGENNMPSARLSGRLQSLGYMMFHPKDQTTGKQYKAIRGLYLTPEAAKAIAAARAKAAEKAAIEKEVVQRLKVEPVEHVRQYVPSQEEIPF